MLISSAGNRCGPTKPTTGMRPTQAAIGMGVRGGFLVVLMGFFPRSKSNSCAMAGPRAGRESALQDGLP